MRPLKKLGVEEKNNHCLWPVCGVGFSVFPWEGVIGKLRGVPDKYFLFSLFYKYLNKIGFGHYFHDFFWDYLIHTIHTS